MNGGGGNYSPGGGGTPNNRGHHYGGNPGQQNSIDYLRALNEAQYGGGIEYLSPLGRHLTMQQEIELRRRQIEEQHLISELEYQNQLRRLQQQQQLQGQLGNIYGQSFQLPGVSDDFLLQQQQHMFLQEQLAQQQMHAHMNQQRDQEELLSMLHRRANQNFQIPPTTSFPMEEPLPEARQGADTETRHETVEPVSYSNLVSPTAAKANEEKEATYFPPKKPSPSPAKPSSPRKSSSHAKGEKSSRKEKTSREHKSKESKKQVKSDEKASRTQKKSRKGHLVATEAVDFAACDSVVDQGTRSREEEGPKGSPPKRNRNGQKAIDRALSKSDKEHKKSKDKEANVDKAADILVNFAQVNVSADEIRMATEWNKQIQPPTTTLQATCSDEAFFASAGMEFNIPSVPSEPESSDESVSEVDVHMEDAGESASPESGKKNEKEKTLTEPEYISIKANNKFTARDKEQDEWWPSKKAIRQERRKRGLPFNDEDTDEEIDPKESQRAVSFNKSGLQSMKKRMKSSVEPGVLEKLPHCKLYEDYCNDQKKSTFSPKFCCQTTETFPYKAMVCCSICSTWRHAQCGGHYKRYSSDSTDLSNMMFVPICDSCYHEKPFLEGDAAGAKRLDRQRSEHLRTCNATNAVMRQFAFNKHAGPYKWPLGNVCTTHLSGHTKSVAGRHEKSEKQWADMIGRLGKTDMKARERLRVRTRDFERIMLSVEDAEGVTDRHNMTLFLRNDVMKPNPVGFENPRRNIFDPEDDLIGAANPIVSDSSATASASNLSDTSPSSAVGMDAVASGREGAGKRTETGRKPTVRGKEENQTDAALCRRHGCSQKPRFDSIFCSDSCGVSAVEADLLQTLEYASEMHPTSLR